MAAYRKRTSHFPSSTRLLTLYPSGNGDRRFWTIPEPADSAKLALERPSELPEPSPSPVGESKPGESVTLGPRALGGCRGLEDRHSAGRDLEGFTGLGVAARAGQTELPNRAAEGRFALRKPGTPPCSQHPGPKERVDTRMRFITFRASFLIHLPRIFQPRDASQSYGGTPLPAAKAHSQPDPYDPSGKRILLSCKRLP